MMSVRSLSRNLVRAGVQKRSPTAWRAPAAMLATQKPLQLTGISQMPALQMHSRSCAAIASGDIGVPFRDLLTSLDVHYGLASQWVQEPLAELAHILGYVRVAADTLIEFGDAKILMEEIGVPPLEEQQLQGVTHLNAAASEESGVEQTLDDAGGLEPSADVLNEDDSLDVFPELAPPRVSEDDVYSGHKTRLSRNRRC